MNIQKKTGTPAATMPNQIHYMTKKSRYNKIMKMQKQISEEKLKENIGKKLDVLIEGKSLDKKYLIGRTRKDAPDIDGVVYIKTNDTNKNNSINNIIKCKITNIKDYDLIAE